LLQASVGIASTQPRRITRRYDIVDDFLSLVERRIGGLRPPRQYGMPLLRIGIREPGAAEAASGLPTTA
jgi:hypothetical protein